MKQAIVDFLTETFFPSFCLGCEKEGTLLCYDCKYTLEISENHYCLCNKNPFRIPFNKTSGQCSRCSNKKLSGLYAALSYKEKWLTRKIICQFKYPPYLKKLSSVLSHIILGHLVLTGANTEKVWQNSALTPIPMDTKKIRNRGYNQSAELAKELAKIVKSPVILNNLVKIKSTQPQTELTAKEREENVKDVFAIKNPSEFKGKKVFLVDDVYTTGSTMEECARVLKESGTKSIWGISVAREG